MSKKGMIVLGVYVKGRMIPDNDRKADMGVNLCYWTTIWWTLMNGWLFLFSIYINK